MREPCFRDRIHAGQVLAAALAPYRRNGTVVLGIPRGGMVVAAEVARTLEADLDVIVAKKIGAPGQQELAIGAVTADGGRALNDDLIDSLRVSQSYLDAATEVQIGEAQARERRLRGLRPPVRVAGRVVIIVDDGLATGATALAAARSVAAHGPAKVVVAVPVGSDRACAMLRREVEVVCPHELGDLVAVGFYYREFAPVEEAAVADLLRAARASRSVTATTESGLSEMESIPRSTNHSANSG